MAVLPFALGAFLVLLAVGAVGHALATAVHRRRGTNWRSCGRSASPGCSPGWWWSPRPACSPRSAWRSGCRWGWCSAASPGGWSPQSTPLAYHPPLAVWALVLIGPLALLAANLLAAWPGHRAARLRSAQILRAE